MIKGLNRNLPEQGKIKIGGKGDVRTSKAGREYRPPEKWDYIRITTLERDDHGDFIVDEELTKNLGDGTLEPKSIGPCMFIFNEPELNFYTTFAYYVSSKCICKGNGETAHRLQDNDEIKEITCDPKKCEFARANKCKPNGILSVLFPWSGTIGGVYKFRTTSWNSIISLQSQLEMFWTLTGGRLSGPKFVLKINSKDAMPGGKKVKIYFMTLEFAGDINALLEAVPANPSKQLDTREAKLLMLESAGEVDEDLDEFYPEHSVDDSGMVTDNDTGEIVDQVDDEPEVAPESPFSKKAPVPEATIDRNDEADKVHLIETQYVPASKEYAKQVADYEEFTGKQSIFPAVSAIAKNINPDAPTPNDMSIEELKNLSDTLAKESHNVRNMLEKLKAENEAEEVEATPTTEKGDDGHIF